MPDPRALPVGASIPNWRPAAPAPRDAMQGAWCRVEPLDPDAHAASLHDANCLDRDGGMWTYMPYGPFDGFGAYRDWVERVAKGSDPLYFAIVDGRTGRAAGVASYLRIEPADGVIEVGHLAYSPLLQRRRAATEAMFLMMARAFALGYRRYEWKCDSRNAGSRAAAQRLGFSYEGVFRQHRVVKGRNRDTAWYSVIDREWPALRAAFERWLAPGNFDAEGAQRASLSALTAPLLMQRG